MAQDAIDLWLAAFQKAMKPLPEDQRRELIDEVRGHLDDRRAAGLGPEQALHGFGAPEAYAQTFIEQHTLNQALESRGMVTKIMVLLGYARQGLAAFLALICLSVCMLLGLLIIVMFITDILDHSPFGTWQYTLGHNTISIANGRGFKPGPGAHLITLGLWEIPLVIAALAALWFIVSFNLRVALRALMRGAKAKSGATPTI